MIREDYRGQSETLGFIIVIGIIVLGALLVAGIGAMALSDTQDTINADRAETELTQLDAQAGMVALGETSGTSVSLNSDNGNEYTLAENAGSMTVSIMNRTNETVIWEDEFTLGAIIWEGDGDTVAYQGGGVFRADQNGGQMVSPPEFHFRGDTLTLPIITVEGDGVLSQDARIESADATTLFPRDDLPNPLTHHEVSVTVQSDYYRGWGEFMESRTDGETTINSDTQEVTLDLVTRISETEIGGAVSGHSTDGHLNFQGDPSHPCDNSGNQPPYFDSYDSTQNTYCGQYDPSELRSGGNLIFGGDIDTSSASGQVQGQFTSGGDVDLHQNMDMHGDVYLVGEPTNVEDAQDGAEDSDEPYPDPDGYDIHQIDSVETDDAIDRVIELTLQEARDSLDHTTISNGDVIEDGEYLVEDLDITGELTFDTSDGDITVVIEDTVSFEDANVEIHGDGEVSFFVGGDDDADWDFTAKDSTIWAPDENGQSTDDATSFTIMGDSDFQGAMSDGNMTGVVYAPGEEGSDATFFLTGGGNVYGAIVTGDMEIGQAGGTDFDFGSSGGGTVHYDRAVTDQAVVPPDFGIVRLTFLHISHNTISVSN